MAEITFDGLNENSLIMQWNTDDYGNPKSIHINNEIQQVSPTHNIIQLAQIPDEYHRARFVAEGINGWLIEVRSLRELKNIENYYVDYNHGVVYFHEEMAGRLVRADYYGRGVMFLSDTRIFHKSGDSFATTLDEVLEKSEDALKLIESTGGLNQAIELLEDKAEEGNKVADRLENFITETQFYGYTIVLSREAFVVRAKEDGNLHNGEMEDLTVDVVVYKGVKNLSAPDLDVRLYSTTNCECEIENQKLTVTRIDVDCIQAQAIIEIDCGDGLIAYRTIEVTKVFDGVSQFNVEMTNAFHSFSATHSGKIEEEQSVTCEFTVTKANEEFKGYVVGIQNVPNGITHNLEKPTENASSVTFTAQPGISLPDNASISVVFQFNDYVITKTFAFTKSKQGLSAKSLRLTGNQIIHYENPNYEGTPNPVRTSIIAQVTDLSGTPVWSYLEGEEWIVINGQNGTNLNLYHNDRIWGTKHELTIKCELDGFSDEITLIKIANGANGADGADGAMGLSSYSVILSNESTTLRVGLDGKIPTEELTSQYTRVTAFRGADQITPTSIIVPQGNNYEVSVSGSTINLIDVDTSASTVNIPIEILLDNTVVVNKVWSIAKTEKGEIGVAGAVYSINVEGGTRAITYNQLNENPRPTFSGVFTAHIYENGNDITSQIKSWYWTTQGHFTGTSINSSFTPEIKDRFDESILNNSVTVTAIYNHMPISYTVPIVVSKDLGGLDWVTDWDSTKVLIRDTEVLTPKLFAGEYNPHSNTINGVAIGTDVLNDGQVQGITGYQNNKVSFLLATDGSLLIGNPFEDNGTGLSYNHGRFVLNVDEMAIAGDTVPTWDDMETQLEHHDKDIINAIQDNIDAMNETLNDMTTFVDTILQDELITTLEKVQLDALFQTVTQEVNNIQAQYDSVINNPYLADEDVRNLEKCHVDYMNAYSNIVDVYNDVFGEPLVEEIEYTVPQEEYLMTNDFCFETVEVVDSNEVFDVNTEEQSVMLADENVDLNPFMLDTLITRDGYIIVTKNGQPIQMVTENTLLDFSHAVDILREYSFILQQAINEALLSISENKATQMVEEAKEEVRQEIADVDSALSDLETTMNGSFKSGLIGEQSKAILNERLMQLDIEKKDVDGQYEVLIQNSALDTLSKEKLRLAKIDLDAAHDVLVAKINQVIIDNLMTDSELQAVNNLISEYANELQNYSKAAQECNATITVNTANLAVEAITDEYVFNKVTNYGVTQGLFIKDEKVYINSEYINTRNFKAVTDDGKETFKIDENGEVSITAKSLAITGSSNLATQDYVNTQIENLTNTNITFTLSNEFQIIPTDESYYPLSEGTYAIKVTGYKGSSEEITDFTIGTVTSNDVGIVPVVSNINKTIVLSVSPDAPLSDSNGYVDIPISYDGRDFNKRWSWAVSKQGNQATTVTITGEQFFKYTNNYTGTPTPNKITLTANVFNSVEEGKWQYNDNGTWVDWKQNGSVVTSKQITLTPTEATLPSLLRVFVRYYVDNVFDTYTVTCISDGGNGKDGIDGSNGKDGTSYYFYVRYSANANGYPMTIKPESDTLYIGTYSGTQSVAPSTYSSYTWTLIKGADGENGQDGVAGKDGEDGQTSYLHIKYSDDGETFTANNGEDLGKWIGTKVDFTEKDSTTFSDYKWKRFVGEDGSDGSNGINAQYIMVTGGQTFKYTDNFKGNPTPTSITLSATTYNVDKATYQWYYKQDNSSTWNSIQGATSSKYILDHNNTTIFANNIKVVGLKCIVNSQLEDEITIVKITDGSNGQDGEDGKDGKSVIAITEKYYLSTSQQSLINGNWVDKAPTWEQGKYIWTKTIFTYSDNTTLETTPICVTGKDGADGLNGGVSVSGVDIFYYQSTSSTELTGGTWSTNAPTWVSGKYVWSKTITYLDNGTSYESDAVCVTGEKGQDGIDGTNGKDGVSNYFFIRYSAYPNGAEMTETPTTNTKYMGTATSTTNQAPTSAASYKWTLVRGTDGKNGQDGTPGVNGSSSYLHVKYSNDGVTFTEGNGEELGTWIGIYVDTNSTDSTNFADYNWTRFVGKDGANAKYVVVTGDQTFRYEDNFKTLIEPQSITLSAIKYNITETGKWQYKGTNEAWTDLGSTESQYVVTPETGTFANNGKSLSVRYIADTYYDVITIIKVSDGRNGTDGTDGIDGVNSYFYIRYSSNPTGSEMTESPNENSKYLGTCSTTSPVAPSNYTEYKWSLVKGTDGTDGTTIVNIKEQYYLSTSQQTLINGEWLDNAPTWTTGKYIWTRTVFSYNNNTETTTDPICVTGKDGADGLNGGVSVKNVDVFYYQSTSPTQLTGGSWQTNAPVWTNGKYVWTKTITYLDNGSSHESQPVCITGEKGQNGTDGIQGEKGEDGRTSYLHIKYSDNGSTFTSNNGETIGKWIGTYVDFTEADSTNFNDYTWKKYVGEDGTDGVDGIDGIDGTSSYFYVRYSVNSNGNPMTTIPNTNTKYIGVCSTTSSTAPSLYSSYTWSKFIGEDGYVGRDGIDGTSSYLHIKYSNDGGLTFTSNNGEDLGLYIGTYVNNVQADSSNVADYKWSKFVGTDGKDGIDGVNGEDGISTYFYVRYSANPNGSSMTSTPTSSSLYMGVCSTTNPTAPTNASNYQWSLIKGADGQDGTPGVKGEDGRTSYLHIKYSNDGGSTFTSNNGEDVGTWIGTYVDFIEADSNSTGSYTWKKFVGDDGVDGIDGYSVLLTNENHTFPADYIGNIATAITITTTAIGYKGATPMTPSIGTLPTVNGLTLTKSNNIVTIKANTGTNLASNGNFTIPVILDGKTFNKVFSWTKSNAGRDGRDGIDGVKGEDGTSYYFYIRYSANADGSNMTNIPQSDTEYMGVCSTTLTEAPTSSSAYDWTLIKGADGEKGQDGISGEDGKDGTSSFLHVKYSDDGGVTFTANNGETLGKWIGTYVDYTEADSNTTSKYTWAKFIGEDGKDGKDGKDGTSVTIKGTYTTQEWESVNQSLITNATTGDGYIVDGDLYVFDGTQFTNCGRIKGEDGKDGANGTNGTSSFLHIKYSNDNGQTFTNNNGEDIGTYIGTYVDNIKEDSTVLSDYKWTKFVGDNGADAYTIVLTNENHSFMANSSGNITESSSTTTKIMAFKGATPITPTIGTLPSVSGLTLSKSGDTVTIKANTGMSLAMSGSFNIPITVDGKSFTKSFSWSKSLAGTNGTNGKGIKSIVNKYLVTPLETGVTKSTSGWSDVVQQIDSTNKYLWNYEIITYTDNSTTETTPCVIGRYAVDGQNGQNGEDGIGVSSIIEYYLISSSTSTPAHTNSNWSTTVKTPTKDAKYLWNYSEVVYTKGDSVKQTPRIIGNYAKDGQDGQDGASGSDAYTVLLTNENHTFVANHLGVTAEQIVTTDVIAYKGATPITPTIGTLPSVTGLTLAKSGVRITIKTNANVSTLADSGSFNIPITVDGKSFTKSFSWTKVKDGQKGEDGQPGTNGTNAKSVDILASNMIFKSTDGGTTFTPDTITLTPKLQNLTHSNWQYSTNGGSTWSGLSNSITGWNVSNNVLTINKSCSLFTKDTTSVVFRLNTTDSSFYDIITITKLYDVADVDFEGIAEDIAQDKVDELDSRLNQQAVFNRLTNNGTTQGIYLEDGELYVNGEFINSKNFSSVDNKGNQTFLIDSNGNVHINANTFTLGGKGVPTSQEVLNMINEYGQSENLVLTPNFNSGSLSPNWTWSVSSFVYVDTTYKHDESTACRLKGSASAISLNTKNISISSLSLGTTYKLSMWVYCTATSSVTGEFQLCMYGKSSGSTSNILVDSLSFNGDNLAANKWTRLSFEFTSTQEYSNPSITVKGISGSIDAWVTDFELVQKGESFTQEQLINIINGAGDGFYLLDGEAYINAEYIQTGTIRADLIKVQVDGTTNLLPFNYVTLDNAINTTTFGAISTDDIPYLNCALPIYQGGASSDVTCTAIGYSDVEIEAGKDYYFMCEYYAVWGNDTKPDDGKGTSTATSGSKNGGLQNGQNMTLFLYNGDNVLQAKNNGYYQLATVYDFNSSVKIEERESYPGVYERTWTTLIARITATESYKGKLCINLDCSGFFYTSEGGSFYLRRFQLTDATQTEPVFIDYTKQVKEKHMELSDGTYYKNIVGVDGMQIENGKITGQYPLSNRGFTIDDDGFRCRSTTGSENAFMGVNQSYYTYDGGSSGQITGYDDIYGFGCREIVGGTGEGVFVGVHHGFQKPNSTNYGRADIYTLYKDGYASDTHDWTLLGQKIEPLGLVRRDDYANITSQSCLCIAQATNTAGDTYNGTTVFSEAMYNAVGNGQLINVNPSENRIYVGNPTSILMLESAYGLTVNEAGVQKQVLTNGTQYGNIQTNIYTGNNIEIWADSDCSTTTEYVWIGAGGNAITITSSGTGQSNTNVKYNGNPMYHEGNVYQTLDNAYSGRDVGSAQGLRKIHSYNLYNKSLLNGDGTSSAYGGYWSVLHWGNGTAGSAQLAIDWTSGGKGCYMRSLRDVDDNWFKWKRIGNSDWILDSTSDERYKRAVSDVSTEDCYNMVKNIELHTYLLLTEEERYRIEKGELDADELFLRTVTSEGIHHSLQMGVLAQDMLKYSCGTYVVNQDVLRDENGELISDRYGIDAYNYASAILGGLQEEIKVRDEQYEELKKENEDLKARLDRLEQLILKGE